MRFKIGDMVEGTIHKVNRVTREYYDPQDKIGRIIDVIPGNSHADKHVRKENEEHEIRTIKERNDEMDRYKVQNCTTGKLEVWIDGVDEIKLSNHPCDC